MRNINFLILIPHAKCKSHLVFNDQFTFLKPGYCSSDFLEFLTTHTKQVLDNLIIYSLLFHNQRVLSIGIKVKTFGLKTAHILSSKDNT